MSALARAARRPLSEGDFEIMCSKCESVCDRKRRPTFRHGSMESYDCAVVVFVDERATKLETRGTERVVDVDGCHDVYGMDDVNA